MRNRYESLLAQSRIPTFKEWTEADRGLELLRSRFIRELQEEMNQPSLGENSNDLFVETSYVDQPSIDSFVRELHAQGWYGAEHQVHSDWMIPGIAISKTEDRRPDSGVPKVHLCVTKDGQEVALEDLGANTPTKVFNALEDHRPESFSNGWEVKWKVEDGKGSND